MLIRILGAAAAVFFLVPQTGWAQEPSPYARPGIYAGVGILATAETGANLTNNTAGISGRLGARVRPHFGVEVAVDFLPGLDARGVSGDLDTVTTTLSLKVPILLDQLQPYLIGGLGAQATSGDAGIKKRDAVWRGGGGVDFYLNERMVVFGEALYVYPMSSLEEFDYFSFVFGIQYRFSADSW